jgi:hypothetical protein
VTFPEPLGRHTVTAIAKDTVGNAATTSTKVRNT